MQKSQIKSISPSKYENKYEHLNNIWAHLKPPPSIF